MALRQPPSRYGAPGSSQPGRELKPSPASYELWDLGNFSTVSLSLSFLLCQKRMPADPRFSHLADVGHVSSAP